MSAGLAAAVSHRHS